MQQKERCYADLDQQPAKLLIFICAGRPLRQIFDMIPTYTGGNKS